MQEEVTKHTKKIFNTIKDPRHSVAEKVKEIIIEVCIIVFAVTLSIWLHSWSEHRHEQEEAVEFLRGLKTDLTKDIELMEQNKNVIARLDSNFNSLLSVKSNGAASAAIDSAISKHFYFDLRSTHSNIGRYEGFKSSGKLETIENDSLKENILIFYQQTIPDLVYGESYVNSLQLKILDLAIDRMDKMTLINFITSIKMKALLGLGVHNFETNMEAYDKAAEQAEKIIKEIDEEIIQ